MQTFKNTLMVNKIVFGLTFFFLVSIAGAFNNASAQVGVGIKPQSQDEKTIEEKEVQSHRVSFNVNGMTCGRCADRIKKALEETEGITESNASYENANVVASYNPDKVTNEQIVKIIEEMGFEVVRDEDEDEDADH